VWPGDFGRYFLLVLAIAIGGIPGWRSRNPHVPRNPDWKPLLQLHVLIFVNETIELWNETPFAFACTKLQYIHYDKSGRNRCRFKVHCKRIFRNCTICVSSFPQNAHCCIWSRKARLCRREISVFLCADFTITYTTAQIHLELQILRTQLHIICVNSYKPLFRRIQIGSLFTDYAVFSYQIVLRGQKLHQGDKKK